MIVKPKKLIYICHPFAGNEANNIERVRIICKLIKNDCVPVAPHLFLKEYISEETERDLALEHGIRLLEMCAELWICHHVISDGMQKEIARATACNIEIVQMHDEFSTVY